MLRTRLVGSVVGLILFLTLIGCGNVGLQESRIQKPIPPETLEFLEKFAVLNSNDRAEGAPVSVGGSTISPFGVFILKRQDPTKAMGICSATHIRRGFVLTSGHCLWDGKSWESDPDVYFVMHYNQDGKKVFARVISFPAVVLEWKPSFHLLGDMLIAQISAEDANNWPPLDADLNHDLALWEGGKTQKVTYWSFDPLATMYPALFATYGEGMKFKKAECTAVQQFPKYWGVKNAGQPDEFKRRKPIGASAKHHLALEKCTSSAVPGNSGGLITLADQPTVPVGLYMANSDLNSQDKADFQLFRRIDPDGAEKLLKAEDFLFDRLMTLGYRFRSSLQGYLNREKVNLGEPDPEVD